MESIDRCSLLRFYAGIALGHRHLDALIAQFSNQARFLDVAA
jgi:hypothetical protein